MIKTVTLSQNKKNLIKIFVSQPEWEEIDWEKNNGFYYIKNLKKSKEMMYSFLNQSSEHKCDIIIFPELAIPESHLHILETWSKNHNIIIIGGSHYRINNKIKNVTPIFISNNIYETEKKNPSPLELSTHSNQNLIAGEIIYKLKETICGNIGVLICADYLNADIKQNLISDDDIDILIVIAMHKQSRDYHQRMEIDINDSNNGLYIIYVNNIFDKHADGNSAIFGLVDNVFKDNAMSHNIYQLENHSNYFIAEVNLDEKKPFISKNVNAKPNISILDSGYLPFTETSKQSSMPEKDTFDSRKCLYIHNSIKKKVTNKKLFTSFLEKYHSTFEHSLIESEQNIAKLDERVTQSELFSALDNYVVSVKKILDLFSHDVAVQFKIVTQDKASKKTYVTFSNIAPSEREVRLNRERKLKPRTKNKLILTPDLNIKAIQDTCDKDNVKMNSAYNESVYGGYPYYICNDLIYAEENGYFINSCENYTNYYKSLLIFPIYDRLNKSENLNKDIIKGFLVIDSYLKGAFDRTYIEHICAVFTHRLNRLLSIKQFKILAFNKN